MTKLYPVHERFYTFQGEGVHMGRPAFFVRLYGCPIHCPWCDSAGTWHKDYVPDFVTKMTASEIEKEVLATAAQFVVVTGGEPTIHNLMELTAPFNDGYGSPEIHLETSGHYPIFGDFHWITLSPKRWGLPLPENIRKAHEFKFILERADDIGYYTTLLRNSGQYRMAPIWLHPEWSKRKDPDLLKAISEAVKAHEYNYRAGWQLHKLYKIDALDSRSRPLVPLGGNPALGY